MASHDENARGLVAGKVPYVASHWHALQVVIMMKEEAFPTFICLQPNEL